MRIVIYQQIITQVHRKHANRSDVLFDTVRYLVYLVLDLQVPIKKEPTDNDAVWI